MENDFLGNVATEEKAETTEQVNASTNQSAEQSQEVVTPPQQGETAEKTAGTSQEKGIDDLNDEQFEKLATRLISEKSPFHNNPAWKRIMQQRNSASQRSEKALALAFQANPEAVKQLLIEEGMDEGDIEAYLDRFPKGEIRETPITRQDNKEEDIDMKLLGLLQEMGIKPDQLSKEQLDFWRFTYKFNKQMMQPVDKFVNQTKEEKQREQHLRIKDQFEKEETELSKTVKEKYGLDWQQDVMPELKQYITDHPQFVGTPRQLFNIVFFDKAQELGKREKTVEDAKLNAEKKSAKTEDGATVGKETLPAGVGKNFDTTWKHLVEKHGYK